MSAGLISVPEMPSHLPGVGGGGEHFPSILLDSNILSLPNLERIMRSGMGYSLHVPPAAPRSSLQILPIYFGSKLYLTTNHLVKMT